MWFLVALLAVTAAVFALEARRRPIPRLPLSPVDQGPGWDGRLTEKRFAPFDWDDGPGDAA